MIASKWLTGLGAACLFAALFVAAPAGGSGAAAEPAALDVVVAPGGPSIDAARLTHAVVTEVERALPPAERAGVRVTLLLDEARTLTVSYRSRAGVEVSRSVPAPARDDELPETAALLAGNLARDEVSGLLGTLRTEPARPVPTPAPAEPRDAVREPAGASGKLRSSAINLSVFHPLALHSDAETRRFWLELGLFYSHIGALDGVGLNAGGVIRVDGPSSGVQLGGIGFVHGGSGEGARIGGVFGVGDQAFSGVDIAGAVSVERAPFAGVELAGAVNVATAELDGAQFSSMFNYSGALAGVQMAGVANVAAGPVDGVQISTWLNGSSDLSGAQLAIVNVGGDVDGVQVGLVNVARDVHGVQLGLVNVARDVDGVSLAYVPYNRRGGVHARAWYSTSQPFNVGVRFDAGFIYAMPTLGYTPGGEAIGGDGGRFGYAPGLSLGTRFELGRAHLDLDVNSSSRSNGWAYDEHDTNLRYRLLAGWALSETVAVFAGGGVHHHFRTKGPADAAVDPEFSAGIELW